MLDFAALIENVTHELTGKPLADLPPELVEQIAAIANEPAGTGKLPRIINCLRTYLDCVELPPLTPEQYREIAMRNLGPVQSPGEQP